MRLSHLGDNIFCNFDKLIWQFKLDKFTFILSLAFQMQSVSESLRLEICSCCIFELCEIVLVDQIFCLVWIWCLNDMVWLFSYTNCHIGKNSIHFWQWQFTLWEFSYSPLYRVYNFSQCLEFYTLCAIVILHMWICALQCCAAFWQLKLPFVKSPSPINPSPHQFKTEIGEVGIWFFSSSNAYWNTCFQNRFVL